MDLPEADVRTAIRRGVDFNIDGDKRKAQETFPVNTRFDRQDEALSDAKHKVEACDVLGKHIAAVIIARNSYGSNFSGGKG